MTDALKQAAQQALDALEEIALAGMSGSGQESEEGMRDWHARQAWKFIGIAVRTLDPLRAALSAPQPEPVLDEREAFEAWHRSKYGGHFLSRNNTPGSDLGGYQDPLTNAYWDAWQARASQPVRVAPIKAMPTVAELGFTEYLTENELHSEQAAVAFMEEWMSFPDADLAHGVGIVWRAAYTVNKGRPLRSTLQQMCYDQGTYWRAADAHGVNLTVTQATELLREALDVEVHIDVAAFNAETRVLLSRSHNGMEALAAQVNEDGECIRCGARNHEVDCETVLLLQDLERALGDQS